MLDKIEPRQIFMALSFGIFASSPFFVLLLPSFIANALYQVPNSWVIVVPAKVYVLYGFGMLFLFITTFLLWALSVNKKSKWLAAICVLISILSMADGSGRYVGVSSDGISFKRGMVQADQHYAWNKIQHVVYREFPKEGGFSKFDFYLKDGEMVTLPEDRHVRMFHNLLVKKLQKEEIEVKR